MGTAFTLAIALLATLGCGQQSTPQASGQTGGGSTSAVTEPVSATEVEDDYVVRVPISADFCAAPIQIAAALGYFDQVGLKWEEVDMVEKSAEELIVSGKCDISYNLMQSVMQQQANGLNVKVVMGVHYGCLDFLAGPNSDIKTIADLKGKRLGVPGSLGSPPALLLRRALTDAGIGSSPENMEVDIRVYSGSDLAMALSEGIIDGFMAGEPLVAMVQRQVDGSEIIWRQATAELTKDEYCCVLGFSTEFLESHPALAEKVCLAVDMACDFIASDPAGAAKAQYDTGRISSEDLALNAELLDSFNHGGDSRKGKESYLNCALALMDLGVLELNETAAEFTERNYVLITGESF
jgi:NitT/TauT family transport system substrate-binding protein